MVEYTIDDIRGPTVAREMAQLKEFVLAQFNGAIADAEAAAAAAATAAANAVIGSLTSRVTALEGDMTTAQGDIITNANAILALDGSVVKLAGTQTITGIKNVPLEATGTASNQMASSQKVKNELDNYAPMVRTTGNQSIAGEKLFTSRPVFGWNIDPNNTYYHEYIRLSGNAVDVPVATINAAQDAYGGDISSVLQLNIYNKANTNDYSRLFITHRPDGTLLQLRRYKNGAIVNTTTIAQIMDP